MIIKLLLCDAVAATDTAAASERKMAESAAGRKCRLAVVSIAIGYCRRAEPRSGSTRLAASDRRG
jgi:hypothetical protein